MNSGFLFLFLLKHDLYHFLLVLYNVISYLIKNKDSYNSIN